MVEIINLEKYKNTKYITRCQCGAELSFKREDILDEKHKVYYGGDELGTLEYTRKYIECPNCKNILYDDEYFFAEVGEE